MGRSSGQAEVNEAVITGRTESILKTPGDWVYADSDLEECVLRVHAESISEQTSARPSTARHGVSS